MATTTISLLSEDELEDENHKKKQLTASKLQQQLGEAAMEGTLALKLEIYRLCERISRNDLRKKIVQYFLDKIGIDISDENFFEPVEPEYSADSGGPVPYALVLHGTDFISECYLRSSILKADPTVFWIDASNCLLTFPTGKATKDTIQLLRKSPLRIKMEEESSELRKNWFDLQDYEELGFVRHLKARYATESQVANPKQMQTRKTLNKYNIFREVRKNFEDEELLKTQEAKKIYRSYQFSYRLRFEGIRSRSRSYTRKSYSNSRPSTHNYGDQNEAYRNNHPNIQEDMSLLGQNYQEEQQRAQLGELDMSLFVQSAGMGVEEPSHDLQSTSSVVNTSFMTPAELQSATNESRVKQNDDLSFQESQEVFYTPAQDDDLSIVNVDSDASSDDELSLSFMKVGPKNGPNQK